MFLVVRSEVFLSMLDVDVNEQVLSTFCDVTYEMKLPWQNLQEMTRT